MVQLKKENTGTGNIKMVDSVWVTQQNAPTQGVNKLSTPDPNYASVRETKPTNTWKQPTSLKQDIGNAIDKVVKPYSEEDIKLSPMPSIGPEIRPEDTFEETAWGWNYDYDRAVSQERNQQGSLNALQWTGHVAGIPEMNVGGLNQYTAPEQGRNVASILPNTGARLEPIDVNNPQATQGTSWANTSNVATGGFNGTTTTAENQRQLKNADINFSQYGDDSSAPNQATRWGENEKYTGDFVKNSNLGYDPNIRTSDLDPNYMFWMDAQWANTDSAGYIARRNDMIASALFNDAVADGRLPTKDDVINYLSQQDGWMNSTEADRFNTIESIWKRLGGLANQTQEWPDMSNIPATYSDEALNNMENDLNQSTAWELYGKVTADQSTHITTLEDDNSVYKSMNEARINAYKQLRGMDSQAIAASIVSGVMASDSQVLRDLMQYDPDKYQYVMQSVKQLRGQMNINAITSWDGERSSSVTNWSSSIQNEKTDFAMWNATTSTNTADILKSVNSTLNSNDVASTASEQMASIENDMFNLQNRLKNLKREANTVFKWDVPQYIVNAYIANRTQEIQDQLWVLENRYNAAYSRYQNEWEKTKWEAEFDLKKQELEIKKQSAALDEWSTRQGIALKWADLNWTTNGVTPLSTLSVQETMNILSDFSSSYATWSHGWQCGEFVKKYLAQIGVNLPNMSSLASKQSLIDDSITEPNQWDVVIMSSANYPENWHMAIVEWIDDDGTIHLLESNWGGDENVHRRTISPNDKRILGYYRPSGWTSNAGGSNGGEFVRKDWVVFDMSDTPTYNSLTYDQQNVVQQLLNLNKNPNTITKRQYWDDFEKILSAVKEINPAWTEDDFKQMSAYRTQWNKWANWGWISRNATSVKAAKELYEMVDSLDNIPNMTLNQLINASEQEFGWTKIAWFKTKLEGMIVEAAGALKWGNAANSDQDIQRMNNILDTKMSKWQIKTAIKELVNLLYWKNESEAQTYWELVLTKPKPIWVDEVTDWMYDDLWITTIPQYYNYSPNGWWYAMWQTMSGSNNLSNDEMVNNIFTY